MQKLILSVITVFVVIATVIAFSSSQNIKDTNQPTPIPDDDSVTVDTTIKETPEVVFATPKKAAHFVKSSPEHGTTVIAAPQQVQISFNFDLGVNSNIAVTRDGKDYSTGNTIVSSDRLVLSKGLQSDVPNGLYTVSYTACWPDGSCHDGSFQFAVNR